MKGCRPLTEAEVQACLTHLALGTHALRNKALFTLGLKSGFRISELLSLKIGNVFQNGNFVNAVSVDRKHMKKKTEGRTVPLNPEAKKAIEFLVQELKDHGHSNPDTFLFKSRKGQNKPMDRKAAWTMLKNTYAKCGLTGKLGTHSMRKTFAKKMYEKLGKDLLKTQKALGHSRITSTVSYLSSDEDEVYDAILKD